MQFIQSSLVTRLLCILATIAAVFVLTPVPSLSAAPASKQTEDSGIVETEGGIVETEGPADDDDDIEIVETEEPSPKQQAVAPDATLVLPFTGPRAKKIRERVMKALAKDGIALAPNGIEGKRKFGSPIEYVGFGQETGIRGYVNGKVTGNHTHWSVAFTVRSAKTGGVVGQAQIGGDNLPALLKQIDAKATEVLGTPLSKTERAPKDGPAPTLNVQLRPDFAKAPPTTPETAAGEEQLPSPFEISVGGGFMLRNFTYKDPLADSYNFPLVPHENVGLATPMVEARWFPGAHSTNGPLANIGVDFTYRQSVAGNTVAFGQNFPTSFTEFTLGIRGRALIGSGEFDVYGGFGTQTLELQQDNLQPAGQAEADPGILPDVTYKMARFGIDGKVPLTETFSLEPGLFVRLVTLSNTDPGQITEPRWFPNATADGIDARLALVMAVTDDISLKGGLDIRRYGFSMNNDLATTFQDAQNMNLAHAVAGGAVDQYLGAFLLASYVLPGKAKPPAEEEEEEEESKPPEEDDGFGSLRDSEKKNKKEDLEVPPEDDIEVPSMDD